MRRLLLLALLLPFALTGCLKKPGEAHLDECAERIRFRGPQKPEIGFGDTPEAIEFAGKFSQRFKLLWDSADNNAYRFDQKEPKTFCQISGDTIVFIAYIPDAQMIRKQNVEIMCNTGWAALGVLDKKQLSRFKKAFVILRAAGMYGPLASGLPTDKLPTLDRSRNAYDAVYPYFAGYSGPVAGNPVASSPSPRPEARPAAPAPEPAPPAASVSANVDGNRSSVLQSDNPKLPEAGPEFRHFAETLKISGTFQGNPAKAILNGKLFRAGETLEPTLGIVFTDLDAAKRKLLLRDSTGAELRVKY